MALLPAVVTLVLAAAGCAQGAGGGGTSGRGDAGPVVRTDGGRRDGGSTRDAGPACMDEGNGAGCEMATDLGALDPGDSLTTMTSVLPRMGDEDWFLIGFPSTADPMTPGMMGGGGEPSVEFVVNEGDHFRLQVNTTCTATLGCGDEGTGARDVLEWTFNDDPAVSMTGEGQFSTRNVPWPSPIYVRVYRATGEPDCSRFQLRVSR